MFSILFVISICIETFNTSYPMTWLTLGNFKKWPTKSNKRLRKSMLKRNQPSLILTELKTRKIIHDLKMDNVTWQMRLVLFGFCSETLEVNHWYSFYKKFKRKFHSNTNPKKLETKTVVWRCFVKKVFLKTNQI